jgi:hypothetical protein
MRYRYCLTTNSGALETLYFTSHHFEEAGLRYMSTGMPFVEAFMLINKWNAEGQGRYAYWLGEGQ